jgi:nucleoside-diphosphate-sugar epimerase
MIRSSVVEADGKAMASRLAPLRSSLDGASVLVTGATGFVGTWTVEALDWSRAALGLQLDLILPVRNRAKLAARLPQLADAPWVQVVEGDIREFTLAASAVDFVVHAASTVSPLALRADPAGTQHMVIEGTRHVLSEAARCGARRALLVSSGSVYGAARTAGKPLSETEGAFTDPFAPHRVLPEAKRAAEALGAMLGASLGMEVLVARGFAMSGPWLPLDAEFALGNFVADALAKRPVRPKGTGSAVRSYLYGADVAVWLLTVLLSGSAGSAYNVGGSSPYRIRDVARLVAERAGIETAIEASDSDDETTDYLVPDTQRAAALGLAEWTPLSTAIDRMLSWHAVSPLSNPLTNA